MSHSKTGKSTLPEAAVVGSTITVEDPVVNSMSGIDSLFFKRGTEPGMQHDVVRSHSGSIRIKIPDLPGTVTITGRYAACTPVREEDRVLGTLEIVAA
ncbi:hypothetical protein [Pseudomonas sp. FEN]|uniref:hypothetical protein n=1 Tax=Pseudomonas sp. FEN TaxID=2767468 RepID=UPI00174A6713|nr:hypothetical protein [Pseudomonas sp. FEN]